MAGLKSSDRAPSRSTPTKETPPSAEDTLPALPPPSTTDPNLTPTHHHPLPAATHPTNSIPHSLPLPAPLPLPFHPLHQERSYLLTSLQHADSTATHLVRHLAQTQLKLDRLLSPNYTPSKRGAKSISQLRRQLAQLKRRLKEAENEEKVILGELGRVVGKIQRVERWVGVRAVPASEGAWGGDWNRVADEGMAALMLGVGPGAGFEVHHFQGATRTSFPVHGPQHQLTGGGEGAVPALPGAYWNPPSHNPTSHPPNTNPTALHIYAHEPLQHSPYPPILPPPPVILEEHVGATAPVAELDGSPPHAQMRNSTHGSASTTTGSNTNTDTDGTDIIAILLDRAETEGRTRLPLERGGGRGRRKSLPVLDEGEGVDTDGEGEGTYMGYGFVNGHVDGDVGAGTKKVWRKVRSGGMRASF